MRYFYLLIFAFAIPSAVWSDDEAGAGMSSEEQVLEIPDDLSPTGGNVPRNLGAETDHYDDDGFPEDIVGMLAVERRSDEYLVSMKNESVPYLLYAQFSNVQRDGVFLARRGDIRDPLPTGELQSIPYGFGALKLNTVYVSLLEGMLIPHFSDNQKEYEFFPLQDLCLGTSIGITGLMVELRYVRRETLVGYTSMGLNFLGWFDWDLLAPLNYYVLPLHIGGGLRFPNLPAPFLGPNHWTFGGDMLIGLGDGDGDPLTPSFVWIPGVFFEIELDGLFGWDSRWVGFAEPGPFREDPRPINYHVRALFFRIAGYIDILTGRDSGYIEVNAVFGFRYNVRGPRIPAHRFKGTRVIYLHDDYRDQLIQQREKRQERELSEDSTG